MSAPRRSHQSAPPQARLRTMRGLLGTKLGMSQVFDESSRVVPVTVIQPDRQAALRGRHR